VPQFQMNLPTKIECVFVKERYICLCACVRERERERVDWTKRWGLREGRERGARERGEREGRERKRTERERKKGEREIVELKNSTVSSRIVRKTIFLCMFP
jgi:hypothetical protein